MLEIAFNKAGIYENDLIVILVSDQLKIDQAISDVDQKFGNVITNILKNKEQFEGKFATSKIISVPGVEGKIINIAMVGTGDETEIQANQVEELGGKIYGIMKSVKADNAGVVVDGSVGSHKGDEVMSLLASGALLSSYKFEHYKTIDKKEEEKTESLSFVGEEAETAEQLFADKKAVAEAVFFARDLVTEPGNILFPESYAERVKKEFESHDVDIEILDERKMKSLGMGALLGVGQGSARESKMVIMQYNGAENDSKPVCFVGKGVTFDTGGISLKPPAKMDAMKYDMGGSAAVVGAMHALSSRKAKVNAVGIIGLVENMPGSNAQRPGDVVHTMSGQTVEVLNTDAEGRLVLADCMTYLQKNFEPECVVDLATLTGAIIVCLANTYAGLFSNDDELADQLLAASKASNEKLWRLPLHKEFDDMLKSPIADVANISHSERGAGSSTAAHFIGRFVEKETKWAHLDIAGVAWESKGKNICPVGATGYGVRLLNQFVADNYEQK